MNTQVYYIDEDNINKSIIHKSSSAIRECGNVVFPTETVYGLGGNALCSEAVNKIFKAKGRPCDNPLIVHICCLDMLVYLIDEPLSQEAKKLIDKFWPGPLTLIFNKSIKVPVEVTAGLQTVAIRMPDNPIALQLIEDSGLPIAAPSANLSGKPSPTLADHVIEDLDGRVEIILCGNKSKVGVESTVLDMSGSVPTILRPGGVTKEQLEHEIGKVEIDKGLLELNITPKSPGMKYTHYAPKGEMFIVKGCESKVVNKINELLSNAEVRGLNVGILASDETKNCYKSSTVLSLGSKDNLDIIASKFFSSLREFDKQKVQIIYAEAIEEKAIGIAVMNRMKKAAAYRIIEV